MKKATGVHFRRSRSLLILGLCSVMALLHAPVLRASSVTVRIAVFDDTEDAPIHERAEIWIRGLGSWWIAKENVKNVPGRDVGSVDTMFIYPDSRAGNELSVKFKMTSEMCSQGCARDLISVAIQDSYVVVSGTPVKAANGKFEVKLKRK